MHVSVAVVGETPEGSTSSNQLGAGLPTAETVCGTLAVLLQAFTHRSAASAREEELPASFPGSTSEAFTEGR